MFSYVSRCNTSIWSIDMSANIDVFNAPRNSTLKGKLEKRVEALEQDVTELTILLHEFIQSEIADLKDVKSRWEH